MQPNRQHLWRVICNGKKLAKFRLSDNVPEGRIIAQNNLISQNDCPYLTKYNRKVLMSQNVLFSQNYVIELILKLLVQVGSFMMWWNDNDFWPTDGYRQFVIRILFYRLHVVFVAHAKMATWVRLIVFKESNGSGLERSFCEIRLLWHKAFKNKGTSVKATCCEDTQIHSKYSVGYAKRSSIHPAIWREF